jgi:hypothetical protein
MALFDSRKFIGTTQTDEGLTLYVSKKDNRGWVFTPHIVRAMKLDFEQANEFKDDMNHINRFAFLKVVD